MIRELRFVGISRSIEKKWVISFEVGPDPFLLGE